jgi:hypothetical protein
VGDGVLGVAQEGRHVAGVQVAGDDDQRGLGVVERTRVLDGGLPARPGLREGRPRDLAAQVPVLAGAGREAAEGGGPARLDGLAVVPGGQDRDAPEGRRGHGAGDEAGGAEPDQRPHAGRRGPVQRPEPAEAPEHARGRAVDDVQRELIGHGADPLRRAGGASTGRARGASRRRPATARR